MRIKNMRTKVVSAALAGVMGLSMCSPVLAMAAEGDTGNSNITIEAEATSISVTVPTNAAFVFKGDGTNVYPSNYEVTNNNGLTAITLNSIDFEGVNGWKLTTEDDAFQADQKKFALWMGARGNELSAVDVNDGVVFAGDTEIKIAPNGSKVLDFQAKRGVFSQAISTENAMQMTMHFDWEHPVKKVAMNAYVDEENNQFEEVEINVESKTASFGYTTGESSGTTHTYTFNGKQYEAYVAGGVSRAEVNWGDLEPGRYPLVMSLPYAISATLIVE